MTGSAVQWLRDQLGIISGAAQSESLARQVEDNGGVYFVPAFSGLFAPYWRSDARGAIVGLSRYNTNAHLARATLESICYQTRDVVEAMEQDSGVRLDVLRVDGGVTANELCHADPGRRARRAGVQAGRRRDHRARRRLRGRPGGRVLEDRPTSWCSNWNEDKRWQPDLDEERRAKGYRSWKKAVERTLDWVDFED